MPFKTVNKAADAVHNELNSENADASREISATESNIQELEQIKREADSQRRDPTREKPGFFSRILSFFSFNSKYKSGAMNDGSSKQRSDNSYEDFLIAKLAYQDAKSDYGESNDGISFTASREGERDNIANDSAAISATRSDGGQDVAAETNVTYKDRLRLIKARANFRHRIFGNSTAEYSSETAQLRLMNEYRGLKLISPEKFTILHNYTDGTDKFGVIASADFFDSDGGVKVRTGSFFIRDGATGPQLDFGSGKGELVGKNFSVELGSLSYNNGEILSDSVTLHTDNSVFGNERDFEIRGSILLSDEGIALPMLAPQANTPRLIKHEDNSIGINMPVDSSAQDGGLAVDTDNVPEEYEDRIVIGAVTFYDVKHHASAAAKKAGFSAKSAEINGADMIALSDIGAEFTENGVQLSATLGFNEKSPVDGLSFAVENFGVSKEGVSFEKITASCGDINIGGVLTVSDASLTLEKGDDSPLSVTASIKDLSVSRKVGDLSFGAKDISGEICFTSDPFGFRLTSGTITADLGDILSVGLNTISYENGKLGFASVSAEKKHADLFGVLAFDNITAETCAGYISKDGIAFDGENSLDLGADLSMFSKPVGKAAVHMDDSTFRGTLDLGKNGKNISPFSSVDLTVRGTVGAEYSGKKLSPVTENAGASLDLFGKISVSADNIAIDGERDCVAADVMTGTLGAENNEKLTVTAKKAAIDSHGYSFEKLTAKYKEFSVLGGVLSFGAGEFSGTAEKISGENITAAFRAGALSASASADISFSKENGYVPSIDKVGKISASVGDFSVQELDISQNEANAEQTDFSAKSIKLGGSKNISITNVKGHASAGEFTVDSASVGVSGIKGLEGVSGSISKFSVGDNGVSFDDITIGKSGFDLCGVVSADAASLSISRPEGGETTLTVKADKITPAEKVGPIGLSSKDLSAEIRISDSGAELSSSGVISASISDLFSFSVSGLSYSDGTIGTEEISTDIGNKKFFGGAVRLDGLSVSAKKLALNKDGPVLGEGASLSVHSDKVKVLGVNFGKLNANVDKDGFSGSAEFLASSPANIFRNISAKVSGKVGVSYKDKLDISLNGLSLELIIFGENVTAEDITHDDSGVTVGKLRGGFSIANNRFNLEGSKIRLSDKFSFEKLSAAAENDISFFGGAVSINKPSADIVGSEKGIEGVRFESGLNFKSDLFSAGARGTVSMMKKDNYSPKFEKISDLYATIASIGTLSAKSIGAEENKDGFTINDLTVTAGGDSVLGKFISSKDGLSVSLGRAVYENGRIKPDWKTLSVKKISIPVTKNIEASLDLEKKKAALDGKFSFPENKAEGEDQLEVGIKYYVLPGVFVNGALFANANADIGFNLACGYALDNESESVKIKDLDFSGKADLKGSAGIGVKASLGLGAPGLNLVEVGIKGSLNAMLDSSITAGIGLSFDSNRKMTVSDDVNRSHVNIDTGIKLVASLDAFAGGKIFALIGKDMFTFNLASKELAAMKLLVNADHSKGKWGMLPGKDGFSLDFTSLFDKMFNPGGLLEYTSRGMKDVEAINDYMEENSSLPLLIGNMGAEEAIDRSVLVQSELFERFGKLREISQTASQKLEEQDSVFLDDSIKRWNQIYRYRMNMVAAKMANDKQDNSASVHSLTDAFMREHFEYNKNNLLKRDIRLFVGFKRKYSTEKKENELFSTESQLKSHLPEDTSTFKLSQEQMEKVFSHLPQRMGYLPPVQVLAYLSETIHFHTGDLFDQNKDAKLAEQMRKYTGIRMAINTIFRNPITPETFEPSFSLSNVQKDDIVNTQQANADDMKTRTQDFDDAMNVTKGAYNTLNKMNTVLIGINTRINKQIEKMTKKKEPADEAALQKLYRQKEYVQSMINNQRRDITGRYLSFRERATEMMKEQTELFSTNRAQLREARNVMLHTDADADKIKKMTDISEFEKQVWAPDPRYGYSLHPLVPYGLKSATNTPVDYPTFRQAALVMLDQNAADNEAMVIRMLTNASYHDSGRSKGTISNQMYKMMFSDEIYSAATGSSESYEVEKINVAQLEALSQQRMSKSIEEAQESEKAFKSLEDLIVSSNDSYIKAENMYSALIKITPSCFENSIEKSSRKVVPAADYSKAVNTLVDAKHTLKEDPMMSPANLDSIISAYS